MHWWIYGVRRGWCCGQCMRNPGWCDGISFSAPVSFFVAQLWASMSRVRTEITTTPRNLILYCIKMVLLLHRVFSLESAVMSAQFLERLDTDDRPEIFELLHFSQVSGHELRCLPWWNHSHLTWFWFFVPNFPSQILSRFCQSDWPSFPVHSFPHVVHLCHQRIWVLWWFAFRR